MAKPQINKQKYSGFKNLNLSMVLVYDLFDLLAEQFVNYELEFEGAVEYARMINENQKQKGQEHHLKKTLDDFVTCITDNISAVKNNFDYVGIDDYEQRLSALNQNKILMEYIAKIENNEQITEQEFRQVKRELSDYRRLLSRFDNGLEDLSIQCIDY